MAGKPPPALACCVSGAATTSWLLDNRGNGAQNSTWQRRKFGALADRAATGGRTRTSGSVYFPGESARASLKRRTLRRRAGPRIPFPGRIGPGLIEAWPGKRSVVIRPSNFPGESARASLKPHKLRHRRPSPRRGFPGRIGPGLIEAGPARGRSSPRKDFPGESARASLKPVHTPSPPPPYRTFPGRIGPGLIEAHRRTKMVPQAGEISRANRPGPH